MYCLALHADNGANLLVQELMRSTLFQCPVVKLTMRMMQETRADLSTRQDAGQNGLDWLVA
jgi:hypothetical protein